MENRMITELSIDRFCDPNGFRSYTREPFSYGGWQYATDGYLCVRVPVPTSLPWFAKMPQADRLFADFPACDLLLGDLWKPYDKAFFREDRDGPVPDVCGCDDYCRECDGTSSKPCRDCDSTGFATPDDDEGEDELEYCDKCKGYAEVPCKACDGYGYDKSLPRCKFCSGPKPLIYFAVPGGVISRRYWLAIHDLPNVRIAPVNKRKAVPFTFDGGQGIVMTIHMP
jgi:hypothetical protein